MATDKPAPAPTIINAPNVMLVGARGKVWLYVQRRKGGRRKKRYMALGMAPADAVVFADEVKAMAAMVPR